MFRVKELTWDIAEDQQSAKTFVFLLGKIEVKVEKDGSYWYIDGRRQGRVTDLRLGMKHVWEWYEPKVAQLVEDISGHVT